MKRINIHGATHFAGANGKTLCGVRTTGNDLLGGLVENGKPTFRAVDCKDCARLYCQIKNAPFNEVAIGTLDRAVYDACGYEFIDEDEQKEGDEKNG